MNETVLVLQSRPRHDPSSDRAQRLGEGPTEKDDPMRAIAVEHFGDDPTMMTLPVPEPGPGELRVRLEATSVNPLDWKTAEGLFADTFAHRFPLVLGFDGAGTVTAVGENVRGFSVGDRVFGQFWGDPIGHGTWAEYTVVPEDGGSGAVAKVPAALSMTDAAALPTAGMTALGALDAVGCGAGDTLLVLGATGGVGTFVTQIAASRGVRVVATAAPGAAERMRELGAHDTIDHRAHPLDETIAAVCPDGTQGILDLVGPSGGLRDAAKHLKDGRSAVSIAFGAGDDLRADRRIRAVNYALDHKARRLAEIGRLAAEKVISPVIGREVPFDDDVLAALARPWNGGVRGKTVIRL
jgi:NADPH:quinone reductase-like Zn-dependent oxidoreductase